MTKIVKEITSGSQFSRSLEDGVSADTQTRTFRVVLDSPQETINIPQECGVRIGDAHPYNSNIYCHTFDARYDGDSRMVLICTFQYKSKAGSGGGGGEDPQSQPPEIRPANWTTSVATYESPVRTWRKVVNGQLQDPSPAANPLGDMYDGIARLEPIVTISITQPQSLDPLTHIEAVGCINKTPIKCGSQTFKDGTVMLRSIQSSPVVEAYGDMIFRGWSATYEFLYKRNPTFITETVGGAPTLVEKDIGWDIAVPQTGFNVKAFNPAAPPAEVDPCGQPLKHIHGKIVAPLALFENVAAGDKVRAMIKVFEYENGGASQTPCAQPIPLTDAGYPILHTATQNVYVYRYCIYKEYEFNDLGLRLL